MRCKNPICNKITKRKIMKLISGGVNSITRRKILRLIK